MIGIITVKDDVHALAVMRELGRRGRRDCKLIAVDDLKSGDNLHLRVGSNGVSKWLRSADGSKIDPHAISVIWLRRPRADQTEVEKRDDKDLINNECRGALSGIFQEMAQASWVSPLDATIKASDKLYQLRVAAECGFRVPETLVSQSKSDVVTFFHSMNGEVVVKPIVGTAGPIILTQRLSDPQNMDEAAFNICPGLYQEYIPGTRHIRLNCFGNSSFAASIDTTELDWRPNLNVPIGKWKVPDDLHNRIRHVLDHLGLEMGIIDLKETPEGDIVWFEVNPQGQFLFLESLTAEPLASHFADYLLSLDGNRS